jgi:hypothetical protein
VDSQSAICNFQGGGVDMGTCGVRNRARCLARRPGAVVVFGATTLLLAGVAGCGPSAADALVTVEGQVRAHDKAMTSGTVILHPDASKGNTTKHEPRGSIEADGRYKIVTHPRAGAPPGWYKVTVIATEPSDPKNPYSLPRSLIAHKFANPDESGITLEVRKDSPPGAYDLHLK